MLTPYRRPAADLSENTIFNRRVSAARVCIEHVNGMLKNRFASLRGLRHLIRNDDDIDKVNDWIEVCCVLHNFAVKMKDTWSYEDDLDADEDDDASPQDAATGHDLRDNIKSIILSTQF